MQATIVIPVFNQFDYTRQCLESLNSAGCDDSSIVVVNNASTDATAEFLSSRPKLRVIDNQENRACAAAWNQGYQASVTTWTMFLNNDVAVTADWLSNLVHFAQENDFQIVSPAMGEGELNYDLERYARQFTSVMKNVVRRGFAQGSAFLVSRKVFETIGVFDENFLKGGCEDDDFFRRAKGARFRLASSGCAYIHHFGNVTQAAVVAERGAHRPETIAYYRKKWSLTWPKRRWQRVRRKTIENYWRWSEQLRYGHTLRERRIGGKIFYH